MKAIVLFVGFVLPVLFVHAQGSPQEKEVIQVIDKFFIALEKQDTATFYNLHLKTARFYVVGERNDSVRTFSRELSQFTFRKDEIIKERMRDTGVVVQIHDRIATVWAPYDLWVNDAFSHCGVDVFTLLKGPDGWKIANCSYTIEKKCK